MFDRRVRKVHYKGFDIHIIKDGNAYIWDIFEKGVIVDWTEGGRATIEEAVAQAEAVIDSYGE